MSRLRVYRNTLV